MSKEKITIETVKTEQKISIAEYQKDKKTGKINKTNYPVESRYFSIEIPDGALGHYCEKFDTEMLVTGLDTNNYNGNCSIDSDGACQYCFKQVVNDSEFLI